MNQYIFQRILAKCNLETKICLRLISKKLYIKDILLNDYRQNKIVKLDEIIIKNPNFLMEIGTQNNSIKIFKYGRRFVDNFTNYRRVFGDACYARNAPIILYCMRNGSNVWDWGLSEACAGENIEIMKLMIEFGAKDWEHFAIISACQMGNYNYVEFLINNLTSRQDYIPWLTTGLKELLENTKPSETIQKFNEKIKILELLVKNGVDITTSSVANCVCVGGNMEMIKKILEHNQNFGTRECLESGCCHYDVTKMLLDKYGYHPNIFIARCNNLDVVKLFLERCAERVINKWMINKCMKRACLEGNTELAKFLIDIGAFKLNSGLVNACQGGHLELAKLMIQYGASEWNKALRAASRSGNL